MRFTSERLLSALQDAESATRGLFIAHSDAILSPLDRAHPDLDTQLQALNALVADDPIQRDRVRELERLAGLRLQALDEAVKAIRAGTFVLPPDPTRSEGFQRMQTLRAQIAQMHSTDDALLVERLKEATRARIPRWG